MGIQDVTHTASSHNTEHYLDQFQEIIRPSGKICMIDDPIKCGTAFLEQQSLSLHHEYMFASSTHKTDDMIKQSQLLNTVSSLIDQGKIKTTLGKINAENLKKAHTLLENQTMIGKIVLEGF
nr:zinc-binding dehydrogenase [Commensalibacter communis]